MWIQGSSRKLWSNLGKDDYAQPVQPIHQSISLTIQPPRCAGPRGVCRAGGLWRGGTEVLEEISTLIVFPEVIHKFYGRLLLPFRMMASDILDLLIFDPTSEGDLHFPSMAK